MADALDASMVGTTDEKGFVPDETRNAFFRKLRVKSDNRSCFECNNRNPTWISLTYGIYLCLECSGEHRRKGVHLSFVRSVELDRFTPEQMAQMAVGGNGKAWEFFKQSGMGKTSDTGRALDYNSKIALRYKQNMEAATVDLCNKLNIKGKDASVASSTSASPAATASPEPTKDGLTSSDFGFDDPPKASPPAPVAELARGTSAPATNGYPKATPSPPPSTVKVLRAVSETAKDSAFSSAVPKASGFVAKQKAKELDFDFDFDSLEKETAASVPVQRAGPQAAAAKAAAGTTATPSKPMFVAPTPVTTAPPASSANGDFSKFANKKGISSTDFFDD